MPYPQFAFMAKTLGAGKLGRLAAAHASYGHEGPTWSAFFYEKLGGSMPDLGVYSLTTLTGLLGPAKHVAAMVRIVTPQRTVGDKGRIQVSEEDNAMVLMDHGNVLLTFRLSQRLMDGGTMSRSLSRGCHPVSGEEPLPSDSAARR
jgi:predicted dehydrogenase